MLLKTAVLKDKPLSQHCKLLGLKIESEQLKMSLDAKRPMTQWQLGVRKRARSSQTRKTMTTYRT